MVVQTKSRPPLRRLLPGPLLGAQRKHRLGLRGGNFIVVLGPQICFGESGSFGHSLFIYSLFSRLQFFPVTNVEDRIFSPPPTCCELGQIQEQYIMRGAFEDKEKQRRFQYM